MVDKNKELMLSDKDIKQTSRNLILASNTSLIPTVVGTCGGVIMFGLEQVVIAGAFAGLVGVGALVLLSNLTFRKDAFKRKVLEIHNKKLESAQKEKIKKLEKELSSEDAKLQISAFERKYSHFKTTLEKQLSTTSFSYQRLLGAFDQVYLLGLSKLDKALDYENNAKQIAELEIRRKIIDLEKKSVLSAVQEEQLTSLVSRLDLKLSYGLKIEELIGQNDLALTKMDTLQSSLTDLHEPKNLKYAMEELTSLAMALNFDKDNAIKLD
jgi:hypothetical protein